MHAKSRFFEGFTLIELLISISILILISLVVLTTIINFRKVQALQMDTDTVIGVLREARNQTLSSKNSTVYGVHFTSSQISLFTGSSYNANASTNKNYTLSSTDTILTINLQGSGSDIVFNRLTGETSQYGSIVVSSPGVAQTKTVTIYKTGLVE